MTENELQREFSRTLIKVCESARPPSSGLSEPVRTTPSGSGSEAAMIYLQTQNQTPKVSFIEQINSFVRLRGLQPTEGEHK